MPIERLWTVGEAAAYLGKTVKSLYQWRYLGVGPKAVRVGRTLRYRPRDIEAWLDRQQQEEASSRGA